MSPLEIIIQATIDTIYYIGSVVLGCYIFDCLKNRKKKDAKD